jgi:hypothetical protein
MDLGELNSVFMEFAYEVFQEWALDDKTTGLIAIAVSL